MSAPVVLTGVGEVEPVTLTVPFPVPVTGGSVMVCLGSYFLPSGQWAAADAAVIAADGLSVAVTVTIGNGHLNPAAGIYYLWARVTGAPGAPDVLIQRARGRVTVDTDTGVPLEDRPAWAPLDSPHFTGTPTVNGQPIESGTAPSMRSVLFTDAATARPDTTDAVLWVGPTQPVHWVSGDLWVNNA